MIDVIPLSACHTEQYGTISVTSLLSFNNYFDPRNAAFGSLLVFNDYRVPPAAGFKMHPHHNCEQLFFVVEGTQKCVDTLNNSLVLKPVTVQRVTAGTGYARETANYGNSMLRFMSVRFQPRCLHTHPYHEMRTFSPSLMADHLLNVVSAGLSRLRRAFRFPSMWMPTSILPLWSRRRLSISFPLAPRRSSMWSAAASAWIGKSSNPAITCVSPGPKRCLWPPPPGRGS